MSKILGLMEVRKKEKKNNSIDIYFLLHSLLWLELSKISIMMELERCLAYGIFRFKLLNTLQVE